jgi:stress-induced morphogen
MKKYFEEIEKKLKENIKIEKITIVDNSNLHKSHKFFSKDKFHLQLNIKSLYLSSMSRLNSQKLVMKVLKEELKNKIHALQISIEK